MARRATFDLCDYAMYILYIGHGWCRKVRGWIKLRLRKYRVLFHQGETTRGRIMHAQLYSSMLRTQLALALLFVFLSGNEFLPFLRKNLVAGIRFPATDNLPSIPRGSNIEAS